VWRHCRRSHLLFVHGICDMVTEAVMLTGFQFQFIDYYCVMCPIELNTKHAEDILFRAFGNYVTVYFMYSTGLLKDESEIVYANVFPQTNIRRQASEKRNEMFH
jgi:hypothetical protein